MIYTCATCGKQEGLIKQLREDLEKARSNELYELNRSEKAEEQCRELKITIQDAYGDIAGLASKYFGKHGKHIPMTKRLQDAEQKLSKALSDPENDCEGKR